MQNSDFFDALMDGRWQPEISNRIENGKYIAKYVQGELVVERSSDWSVSDAESILHDEIRRGTLEGEYYPIIG